MRQMRHIAKYHTPFNKLKVQYSTVDVSCACFVTFIHHIKKSLKEKNVLGNKGNVEKELFDMISRKKQFCKFLNLELDLISRKKCPK